MLLQWNEKHNGTLNGKLTMYIQCKKKPEWGCEASKKEKKTECKENSCVEYGY